MKPSMHAVMCSNSCRTCLPNDQYHKKHITVSTNEASCQREKFHCCTRQTVPRVRLKQKCQSFKFGQEKERRKTEANTPPSSPLVIIAGARGSDDNEQYEEDDDNDKLVNSSIMPVVITGMHVRIRPVTDWGIGVSAGRMVVSVMTHDFTLLLITAYSAVYFYHMTDAATVFGRPPTERVSRAFARRSHRASRLLSGRGRHFVPGE